MKILITGVNGFIASHCYKLLSKDFEVIGLDRNLDGRRLYGTKVNFIHRDLINGCNGLLDDIDIVINMAAETFVDYSIQHPEEFVSSNIIGTFMLLQEARRSPKLKKFIQVSTDEVYGSIDFGCANESFPMFPGNPYSASKASADMLCLSYRNTYGVPITIVRPENNYGTYQGKEKFIPCVIDKILSGQPVIMYGDGTHKRMWLHVEDTCLAIRHLMQLANAEGIYNIGTNIERENHEIIKAIGDILGLPYNIKSVPDSIARPGHDKRYAIDTQALEDSGWEPQHNLTDLPSVVNWYKENGEWFK